MAPREGGEFSARCPRVSTAYNSGMTAKVAVLPLFLIAAAPAPGTEFETERARVRVVQFAAGLEHPWGLAFLPDGRMLVTERPGRLRVVGTDGAISQAVSGVPPVHAVGQGGLLDVA